MFFLTVIVVCSGVIQAALSGDLIDDARWHLMRRDVLVPEVVGDLGAHAAQDVFEVGAS
ncbi:hypothetical protein SK571_36785 [Lentzea sp. BCCO 10_0798]|uniref:Uncharacterized protein n=1 Tax=Lentzea kristufekii TaxID=3095430 RepID=A0ABU4U3W1_9PSEU|nr:hypothetical protein [Lentzea sp. BCCO 10_0798]MDX8054959.1 hypothetical protein [Lentzea sp. BCCO 10_0798]